ncbi:S-methyl-5'-thioadenosine phosphorylase [Sulfolobus acidocaldarius]|uniref:S-methyl-5'-thioadenosine phosphorylase n=4 Tax=Sulfolobus acidocaldarius TaxID=2285 RepID=Q4JA23_SULAC|nr:S-methyl-5'-thioadenosine phosphorylase [Sulfolobus acidocaldarius]AAY80357.1 5'-methylthioadenosine phosphorylase [Sulfolobus acidocaldarius DSM 639]AGE70938.1 5'-methylthioadenosine phosphorylase II [Sulfolobus acidocaldarius N8]AGE73209.1 5'-methylthioadenosine phosphorylase II [Sulfolobus acidocaldarius Ron12/I]ALU28756.1 5'-methylthioadenosine phosphorylase [Sulfolobus acidocaldarius]ALU31476.1 5'-methylthioadenosine phosphorylase [Sulfolobus acidocaldarius]
MITTKDKAKIGIIGGSGLYDPKILENTREIKIYTPYGEPSDYILLGELEGKSVAFLPRHGRGHRIPPHKINYRANIWALKELGVKWLISVSAVGSLRMDYKPGDFVIPDQFIDMTKGRDYTFFDGPVVAHVSMADPFCNSLRKIILDIVREMKIQTHERGTYICIEGPRFSTRAESRVWKEVFKADIIGMTLVPEVNLACEAQMCYSTIAMITDYDVFAELPVTAEEVTKVMAENTEKARKLLYEVIKRLPEEPDERECSCCHSLKTALL